jgi:hypothetical protein
MVWFHFCCKFGLYVKIYLNETFSEIRIGRHFSDTFPKGLKEGVVTLSPLLFSKCASEMSLRDPSKPGGNDETWQLLVYADDVNTLGGNVHTMQEITEALVVASKKTGREVNADKTK